MARWEWRKRYSNHGSEKEGRVVDRTNMNTPFQAKALVTHVQSHHLLRAHTDTELIRECSHWETGPKKPFNWPRYETFSEHGRYQLPYLVCFWVKKKEHKTQPGLTPQRPHVSQEPRSTLLLTAQHGEMQGCRHWAGHSMALATAWSPVSYRKACLVPGRRLSPGPRARKVLMYTTESWQIIFKDFPTDALSPKTCQSCFCSLATRCKFNNEYQRSSTETVRCHLVAGTLVPGSYPAEGELGVRNTAQQHSACLTRVRFWLLVRINK